MDTEESDDSRFAKTFEDECGDDIWNGDDHILARCKLQKNHEGEWHEDPDVWAEGHQPSVSLKWKHNKKEE